MKRSLAIMLRRLAAKLDPPPKMVVWPLYPTLTNSAGATSWTYVPGTCGSRETRNV